MILNKYHLTETILWNCSKSEIGTKQTVSNLSREIIICYRKETGNHMTGFYFLTRRICVSVKFNHNVNRRYFQKGNSFSMTGNRVCNNVTMFFVLEYKKLSLFLTNHISVNRIGKLRLTTLMYVFIILLRNNVSTSFKKW